MPGPDGFDGPVSDPDLNTTTNGVDHMGIEPGSSEAAEKPRLRTGEDWVEIEIASETSTSSDPSRRARENGVSRESPASQDMSSRGNIPPMAEADHKPLPSRPQDDTDERRPSIPAQESSGRISTLVEAGRKPEVQRSDSRSTVATRDIQRSSPLSSMVFVTTSLEKIASSKEARKRKQLGDAAQKALSALKSGDQQIPDPEIIFHPLQLATQTTSIPLVEVALDCIGKLISYSYFSAPSTLEAATESDSKRAPLIERAIETICDCFQGEATPVEVQQQIVKSLLAAVLNDKIVVHGAGLLTAIRQIYNIFIYSKSSQNQQVAQGSLTQMVGTVFERVKTRLALKEARSNPGNLLSDKGTEHGSETHLDDCSSGVDATRGPDGDADADASSEAASTAPSGLSAAKGSGEKLTLQSFEHSKSFDDAQINDNAPTMVTKLKKSRKMRRTASSQDTSFTSGVEIADGNEFADEEEEDEIYIKDAFLVFRSMCKLSTKILSPEQQQDIKSQNMRSKLLSLHLIRTLLDNNIVVFTSPLVTIKSSSTNEPTSFVQAIKQYLCLSLSRNGTSSVNRVFEVSCEIFWLMLKNLRVTLKVRPSQRRRSCSVPLTKGRLRKKSRSS